MDPLQLLFIIILVIAVLYLIRLGLSDTFHLIFGGWRHPYFKLQTFKRIYDTDTNTQTDLAKINTSKILPISVNKGPQYNLIERVRKVYEIPQHIPILYSNVTLKDYQKFCGAMPKYSDIKQSILDLQDTFNDPNKSYDLKNRKGNSIIDSAGNPISVNGNDLLFFADNFISNSWDHTSNSSRYCVSDNNIGNYVDIGDDLNVYVNNYDILVRSFIDSSVDIINKCFAILTNVSKSFCILGNFNILWCNQMNTHINDHHDTDDVVNDIITPIIINFGEYSDHIKNIINQIHDDTTGYFNELNDYIKKSKVSLVTQLAHLDLSVKTDIQTALKKTKTTKKNFMSLGGVGAISSITKNAPEYFVYDGKFTMPGDHQLHRRTKFTNPTEIFDFAASDPKKIFDISLYNYDNNINDIIGKVYNWDDLNGNRYDAKQMGDAMFGTINGTLTTIFRDVMKHIGTVMYEITNQLFINVHIFHEKYSKFEEPTISDPRNLDQMLQSEITIKQLDIFKQFVIVAHKGIRSHFNLSKKSAKYSTLDMSLNSDIAEILKHTDVFVKKLSDNIQAVKSSDFYDPYTVLTKKITATPSTYASRIKLIEDKINDLCADIDNKVKDFADFSNQKYTDYNKNKFLDVDIKNKLTFKNVDIVLLGPPGTPNVHFVPYLHSSIIYTMYNSMSVIVRNALDTFKNVCNINATIVDYNNKHIINRVPSHTDWTEFEKTHNKHRKAIIDELDSSNVRSVNIVPNLAVIDTGVLKLFNTKKMPEIDTYYSVIDDLFYGIISNYTKNKINMDIGFYYTVFIDKLRDQFYSNIHDYFTDIIYNNHGTSELQQKVDAILLHKILVNSKDFADTTKPDSFITYINKFNYLVLNQYDKILVNIKTLYDCLTGYGIKYLNISLNDKQIYSDILDTINNFSVEIIKNNNKIIDEVLDKFIVDLLFSNDPKQLITTFGFFNDDVYNLAIKQAILNLNRAFYSMIKQYNDDIKKVTNIWQGAIRILQIDTHVHDNPVIGNTLITALEATDKNKDIKNIKDSFNKIFKSTEIDILTDYKYLTNLMRYKPYIHNKIISQEIDTAYTDLVNTSNAIITSLAPNNTIIPILRQLVVKNVLTEYVMFKYLIDSPDWLNENIPKRFERMTDSKNKVLMDIKVIKTVIDSLRDLDTRIRKFCNYHIVKKTNNLEKNCALLLVYLDAYYKVIDEHKSTNVPVILDAKMACLDIYIHNLYDFIMKKRESLLTKLKKYQKTIATFNLNSLTARLKVYFQNMKTTNPINQANSYEIHTDLSKNTHTQILNYFQDYANYVMFLADQKKIMLMTTGLSMAIKPTVGINVNTITDKINKIKIDVKNANRSFKIIDVNTIMVTHTADSGKKDFGTGNKQIAATIAGIIRESKLLKYNDVHNQINNSVINKVYTMGKIISSTREYMLVYSELQRILLENNSKYTQSYYVNTFSLYRDSYRQGSSYTQYDLANHFSKYVLNRIFPNNLNGEMIVNDISETLKKIYQQPKVKNILRAKKWGENVKWDPSISPKLRADYEKVIYLWSNYESKLYRFINMCFYQSLRLSNDKVHERALCNTKYVLDFSNGKNPTLTVYHFNDLLSLLENALKGLNKSNIIIQNVNTVRYISAYTERDSNLISKYVDGTISNTEYSYDGDTIHMHKEQIYGQIHQFWSVANKTYQISETTPDTHKKKLQLLLTSLGSTYEDREPYDYEKINNEGFRTRIQVQLNNKVPVLPISITYNIESEILLPPKTKLKVDKIRNDLLTDSKGNTYKYTELILYDDKVTLAPNNNQVIGKLSSTLYNPIIVNDDSRERKKVLDRATFLQKTSISIEMEKRYKQYVDTTFTGAMNISTLSKIYKLSVNIVWHILHIYIESHKILNLDHKKSIGILNIMYITYGKLCDDLRKLFSADKIKQNDMFLAYSDMLLKAINYFIGWFNNTKGIQFLPKCTRPILEQMIIQTNNKITPIRNVLNDIITVTKNMSTKAKYSKKIDTLLKQLEGLCSNCFNEVSDYVTTVYRLYDKIITETYCNELNNICAAILADGITDALLIAENTRLSNLSLTITNITNNYDTNGVKIYEYQKIISNRRMIKSEFNGYCGYLKTNYALAARTMAAINGATAKIMITKITHKQNIIRIFNKANMPIVYLYEQMVAAQRKPIELPPDIPRFNPNEKENIIYEKETFEDKLEKPYYEEMIASPIVDTVESRIADSIRKSSLSDIYLYNITLNRIIKVYRADHTPGKLEDNIKKLNEILDGERADKNKRDDEDPISRLYRNKKQLQSFLTKASKPNVY